MKLPCKIFSCSLLLAYIAVSICTLTDCAKKNNLSTSEQFHNSKQEIANVLGLKYETEKFDATSSRISYRPVLLDSTLIGITQKEGNYFLRTKVNAGSHLRCYAELRCSKEIADSYYRTRSNNAYIVAKITRIDNMILAAEIDSLDGKSSQINLGKSILLGGECLALAEIPSSL